MDPETIQGVDAREIEAVSAKRLLWLRFPPAIEAAYERETGPARSRELFWRGWVALAIYLSLLLSDWYVTPDIFGTAVFVRLGLVTPAAIVMLAILWRNPPVWLREGIEVVSVLMAAASHLFLMLLSTAPMRETGHHAVVLVILYLAILRVPLYYAVVGCLGTALLYHFALVALPDYPVAALIAAELVLGGAIILCLMAIYSIEFTTRLNYLASLRERLLNQRLASLSRQDPLTGLGNRRALEEILGAMEIGRSGRIHLAGIMIDIDHFKLYNDSLGHQEGDVCLRRVAGIIRGELREFGDMAFRFGGEEFLVLLQGLDLRAAIAVGERVRRAVEVAAIPHLAQPTGRTVVTVSVGAASMVSEGGLDAGALVAAADAALYDAKRNGRNLVYPEVPPLGETV